MRQVCGETKPTEYKQQELAYSTIGAIGPKICTWQAECPRELVLWQGPGRKCL